MGLLAVLLVGLFAKLSAAHAVATFHAWNDVRVRPAFLLTDGLDLYPGLAGGLVTTWMYGPVTPLLLWPVTFFEDYALVLSSALGISQALVLGAVGATIVFWPGSRARALGLCSRVCAALIVLLALPGFLLTHVTADNSCLAFGLFSMLALVRGSQMSAPRGTLAWLSAVAVATAVFSKQHAVFVLLGQLVWLAWVFGAGAALRQGGRVLLCVAAWLGVTRLFAASYGAVWDHLVAVPGAIPWHPEPLGAGWMKLPLHLLCLVVAPTAVSIWMLRRTKDRLDTLPALIALVALPMGAAALLKLGGSLNSLHSAYYLAPLVFLLWPLDRHGESAALRWCRAVPILAASGLVVLSASQWRGKPSPSSKAAHAMYLSRAAPETLWLPWRPLAQRLVTGRHFHDEDGLLVREVIGQPVGAKQLLDHLPPRWGETAVEPRSLNWGLALRLMPGARIERRAGWIHYDASTSAGAGD